MEAGALLAVRQVSKRFGSVTALRDADLTVAPGEIHALLGANGAGKSTLVKVLAGVLPADSGAVQLYGRPLRPRRPADAVRAGVATVFQDPAFAPDLSVGQNLRLAGLAPRGLWLGGGAWRSRAGSDALGGGAGRSRAGSDALGGGAGRSRAGSDALGGWAERLGLSDLDPDTMVKDLPLPVLRLLDLARALAHDPQLLVLDEITAALPGDQVERVFAVMSQWRDRDRSVLFITHRLREVLRMCDRATILRDGRTVATLAPGDGGEERLVAPMLGEVVAQAVPEAARAPSAPTDREPGPVVLEARALATREHLREVSFRLHAGEILGVVGLEGQGQDQLFEVLSGDLPAAGGQLLVNGAPVRARTPYDLIRKGVVLVPSDRLHALLPRQSLRANLAAALYNRFSRWFSLARDEEEVVAATVARLAIDTRAQQQVRRLSGGNQQKVAVGRWLAAGFRTMLCFDPTRGIDIHTKEQIYRLLRELAGTGAAILYYTSELTEVPLVCDRVLVMYGGTVVRELASAAADEATLLNAAHGLQEAAS